MADFQPDVLISDRDMHELDGVRLCRHIREQQAGRYTYIVLLTALDQADQVLTGMEAGRTTTSPSRSSRSHSRRACWRRPGDRPTRRARPGEERACSAGPPLSAHGLRNKIGLAGDLEQLHSVWLRYERDYCVAMCDMEFSKVYKDAYRHRAGDQAARRGGRPVRQAPDGCPDRPGVRLVIVRRRKFLAGGSRSQGPRTGARARESRRST